MSRPLPLSAIVVAAHDVLSSELGSEHVLLNLADGIYYGLDDVGSDIWKLLQTPVSVGDICRAIVETRDVDTERCRSDVVKLLGELLTGASSSPVVREDAREAADVADAARGSGGTSEVARRGVCLDGRAARRLSHPANCDGATRRTALGRCEVGDGCRPGDVVWAVDAIGSRVPGTTCLVEALSADCMLRRRGHASALKIGVKRGTAMSIDAHAWVECSGAVVIGTTPELSEYAVLASEWAASSGSGGRD